MSKIEIQRMLEDADRFADEDQARKKHVEAANSLSSFVYGLKSQLQDSEGLGGKVTSEDKKQLSAVVKETEEWIDEHEKTAGIEDLEDKLSGGFPSC